MISVVQQYFNFYLKIFSTSHFVYSSPLYSEFHEEKIRVGSFFHRDSKRKEENDWEKCGGGGEGNRFITLTWLEERERDVVGCITLCH